MSLPSGYTSLQYITSAGNQWFDTGITSSANLIVEICVKPASNGLSENAILGASWSASGFFLMFYNNQVKFHSKGASVTTSGLDTTAKSVIRCTQTALVVNGTSYSLSGGGSDVSNAISLFNVTDAGIGSNNAAMYGDCYYCKMWQGTALVRNYQPCLNGSGVPGMYDLVNGVFYPSTSGTAFIAGPVANYSRLEYIESSGTQYIDTGFKPNQNTRLVMVAQPTATPAVTQYRAFFGFRTDSQYFELIKADGNSLKVYFLFSNVVDTSKTFNIDWTARTTFEINKNVATIGNASVTISSAPAFQSDYSIYLCASNYSGNADYLAPMRIYGCQIYDNGTLVRDYIPYRYNGEVGLWDRVSNTFYGNSGSGAFTAGPDAVYERVEYIQSSGTQYVDTGFVPDANTRVTSMFQMVSPGTANECIFGVVGQFSFRWYGSGGYFRSNGANNVNFATTIPSGARHTVTKTPTTCTIDDVYTVTNTVGTVTSSLYIFAQRGANSPTAYATAKIFSFRAFDGDALVRDFVPVVRSDGTAGLYDQLNEIFYENAGTGAFVAGPVAKYARVEYLESTGTQYIDTGFVPNQDTRAVIDFEATANSSGHTAFFGARQGLSDSTFAIWFSDGAVNPQYGSVAYNTKTLTLDYAKRLLYDFDKNDFTVGGLTATFATGTFSAANNLYLLSINTAGVADNRMAVGKLFSCQIYDNGTLVRDFVPAVRADGTPGLLDRTNNAFYTNSGAGTFVVGPDLDYTKLEYIESSGTQYINTGFNPNQDTRVVADLQVTQFSGYAPLFGARIASKNAEYATWAIDETTFQDGYGTSMNGTLPGSPLNRNIIDKNKNVFVVDGDTLITHPSATFQSTYPLFVFNINTSGSTTGSFVTYARLYSIQIYNGADTLARNYIPALRENGQIGLIDLVSGLFYANAGSGVFIAGPEIVDPDPPEPPGPYEPPSFTEQTLAYLAALRYPFYKLCRLRFLQPDGSTAFSLDNNPKNKRSGAFIADGSISANLQNGKRRNATVVLSNLDSSFDYNANTVWFGTEIAIDEGLVLPDGSEYYIQQGVFAIENPTEAVEPANRTATYNLVDKWSYLDGTLFGNLESTYEVPVGTNIFQPIEAILALDRGNGQPVDGVTPIFTEYYNSKTQALPDGSTANLIDSPYTLRIDSDNGTYADVLLGLAAMVNAWIGYDQTGALRIDPSQDDILDTNKPILWQFSMDEATFLGANYTVRNVDVYNDYIVLGELLDDNSQPAGRATNFDPRSDTNVQTIGRKTFRMSAPGFATDKQCQDLAVWKLKRSTSLQKAISISCSQLFHIEENGLVTIVRTDKPGSPVERHLVMGFTRPLTSNGEMQINAVSVQDFVTATVTSWPE